MGALQSMMLQSFALFTRHLEVFFRDELRFKFTFFSCSRSVGLSNLSLSGQLYLLSLSAADDITPEKDTGVYI